jgi:hypothetical protein
MIKNSQKSKKVSIMNPDGFRDHLAKLLNKYLQMKLIFQILFISFLLHSVELLSQTSTSYPYSIYGIGDIKPLGSGQSRAMGGAGIALSSNLTINNINPASYNAFDSLSFLLNAGLDMKFSKYTDANQHQSNTDIHMGYFALGFRFTSWWANSIGIAPYSSVGDNISTTKTIEGSPNSFDVNLQGTGGINQYYWGNSFKLFKNFNVGVNVSYLLGRIKQTEYLTSNYFTGTLQTQDQVTVSKIYLNYGLQYAFDLGKKMKWTVGAIYGTKSDISLNHNLIVLGNAGDTLQNDMVDKSTFTLPQYYGIGASVKLADKLLITADYRFYQWSQSQSNTPGIKYVNSTNYYIGAELLPSTSFRSSYFAKIKYRAGGYLNNSYLQISGNQIQDMGFSAGLCFPLINHLSLSMAYSIGQRGSVKNSGLISEKYQSFLVDLTLGDLWFIKQKFN